MTVLSFNNFDSTQYFNDINEIISYNNKLAILRDGNQLMYGLIILLNLLNIFIRIYLNTI